MSKPTCLVLLLAGAGGLRGPTASRRTLGVRFARPSSAAPPAPSGELSKAVWAVAANFDGPGRLLEPLKSAGLRQVAEFDARALVDTAFAYAESGVDAADLFDTIEAAAAARLGEFADAELCDLAWAFAEARRLSPALGAALAGELARRDGAAFAADDLQRVAWAYAKGPGGGALGWVEAHVDVAALDGDGLAKFAWSLAKARAGTDATWAAVGNCVEIKSSTRLQCEHN